MILGETNIFMYPLVSIIRRPMICFLMAPMAKKATMIFTIGRKMSFKVRKSHKGSVLIEALLAVVILSVSLVVIIESLLNGVKAMKRNDEYTTAIIQEENEIFEAFNKGLMNKEPQQWGIFPKIDI